MQTFWRALAGSFFGKLLAVLFIAVCLALGFGPDSWAQFMIAGLPEWWTPSVARSGFVAMAMLTTLLLWRASSSQRSPAGTTKPVPTPTPSATADNNRIFVGETVTVDYLAGFYKDHTNVQAERLAQPFLGKWMRIEGMTHDVHVDKRSQDEEGLAQIVLHQSDMVVFLEFPKQWTERVAIIRKGEKVNAIGRLETIHRMWLTLKDCELVEH